MTIKGFPLFHSYLILEHVSGGELFDYLVRKGRLSEREVRGNTLCALAGTNTTILYMYNIRGTHTLYMCVCYVLNIPLHSMCLLAFGKRVYTCIYTCITLLVN